MIAVLTGALCPACGCEHVERRPGNWICSGCGRVAWVTDEDEGMRAMRAYAREIKQRVNGRAK